MNFQDFAEYEQLRKAWEAVRVIRPVHYSLFTFGDSELQYFLVSAPPRGQVTVTIRRGEVKVSRPLIITANSSPEFRDFFAENEDDLMLRFLLARTAQFPNMKFQNVIEWENFATDSVDEAVSKLNRRLDAEEEDRVAVLTAPAGMGGVAVLRYCLERVAQSTPDNLTELRERGFLPH